MSWLDTPISPIASMALPKGRNINTSSVLCSGLGISLLLKPASVWFNFSISSMENSRAISYRSHLGRVPRDICDEAEQDPSFPCPPISHNLGPKRKNRRMVRNHLGMESCPPHSSTSSPASCSLYSPLDSHGQPALK